VPLLLHVLDIFPDEAISLGVLRNRFAIAFFSAVELFLYRNATHISLITEGFRKNLQAKGVSTEKTTVIPVWADPDVILPLPKENDFRKKHGLLGKFVVMYAGNIGLTSCTEDVLAGAELLQAEQDVRFVIVGEGVKKADLQATAQKKGLKNVLFLPFQPREVFAEMLAAADINLVTLNHNSYLTSMPSKTFNIMASARPILAVTPPDSDVSELIEEAKCGINVPPEQPQMLAEAILKMKQQPDQLTRMGKNGRSQLESRFSRSHCIEEHEHMLLTLYQDKYLGREKLGSVNS
jgi:colanic acid biosynthesis glycosyl transferase WcaI